MPTNLNVQYSLRSSLNAFSCASLCCVCTQRLPDGLAKDIFSLFNENQNIPADVHFTYIHSVLRLSQKMFQLTALFPLFFFFLKKFFKNIDAGIPSLESSLRGFFVSSLSKGLGKFPLSSS